MPYYDLDSELILIYSTTKNGKKKLWQKNCKINEMKKREKKQEI